MAFDDLARTRIDHALSVRPSTRRPMHPLNNVVAHVHRVSIFGQYLQLECFSEACRLERLFPPTCTFQQSRLDGFWCCRIEPIDDRLHWLTHRLVCILLLQPVPDDPSLLQRFTHGRAVIKKLDIDEPRARIELARLVTSLWQRDQ